MGKHTRKIGSRVKFHGSYTDGLPRFRSARYMHACVHMGGGATNILPGARFQPMAKVDVFENVNPEESHEAGPHVSIARR